MADRQGNAVAESFQARLDAARQRANEAANLIRWSPEQPGEELVGAFVGLETYNSKKIKEPLVFGKFKAVTGNGNFKKGSLPCEVQEGDFVEVPFHGFLAYYMERQDWQVGDLFLLLYNGKNPYEGSATGESHAWQVEKL